MKDKRYYSVFADSNEVSAPTVTEPVTNAPKTKKYDMAVEVRSNKKYHTVFSPGDALLKPRKYHSVHSDASNGTLKKSGKKTLSLCGKTKYYSVHEKTVLQRKYHSVHEKVPQKKKYYSVSDGVAVEVGKL